jgi:stress-induced morphogen
MSESERKKLVASLKKEFRGTVHSEKVGPKGRFRLEVISPKFKKMTQLQRQDAVWDVVNDALSREATLDVSLILTYSPAELAGAR